MFFKNKYLPLKNRNLDYEKRKYIEKKTQYWLMYISENEIRKKYGKNPFIEENVQEIVLQNKQKKEFKKLIELHKKLMEANVHDFENNFTLNIDDFNLINNVYKKLRLRGI